MRSLRVISSFGLLGAMLWLQACGQAPGEQPTRTTTLLTGAEDGYYQKVCLALKSEGEKRNLKIQCIATDGSRQNVDKLRTGAAEFAIVQSDVAHRAWKGELPFEKKADFMHLVTPLYTEKVHILVSPHQYLISLAQLKVKRMWLGKEDSGSEFSALTILQAAGFTTPELARVTRASRSRKRIDSRTAFALLRAEPDHQGSYPLDAMIDADLPGRGAAAGMLESLGIRTWPQETDDVPKEMSKSVLLLQPELSISKLEDLRGKALWAENPRISPASDVLKAIGGQVTTPDATPQGNEPDVSHAFTALLERRIDALLQPKALDPELIRALLQEAGYGVLRLPSNETTGGGNLVIYTRPSLNIHSPEDLANKAVWWDRRLNQEVSSALVPAGTPEQTKQAWEKLHIGKVQEMNPSIALALLRLRELDVVFQTTVAPSSTIRPVLNPKTEVRPMGIDLPIVEKLIEDGSYLETSLQRTAYPELEAGVYALGVQSLLVTRLGESKAENAKVLALWNLLNDDQAGIQAALLTRVQHDKNGVPIEPATLTLIGSPVRPQIWWFAHKQVRDLLPRFPIRKSALEWVIALVCALAAIATLAFLLEKTRPHAARLFLPALAVASCLLLWMVGAIWLQAVEGDISQEFTSLHQSAWSLAQTVVGHFIYAVHAPLPATRDGQRAMDFFSWLCVAVVGSLLIPLGKKTWKNKIQPRLEDWQQPKPG
jgi:TRAP-type uncharacterized transport system substrate-binding protein